MYCITHKGKPASEKEIRQKIGAGVGYNENADQRFYVARTKRKAIANFLWDFGFTFKEYKRDHIGVAKLQVVR